MQEESENITNFFSRLSQFIENKGVSYNKLSVEIGVSNSYFSKMIRKGGSVGVDIVEKILRKYPDLDANWLITGTSSRTRSETKEKEPRGAPIENKELLDRLEEKSEEIGRLRHIIEELSAEKKDAHDVRCAAAG